jgi:hypothetical protein
MEVLKMTLIGGRIAEMEKLLVIMSDTPEKEHISGRYNELLQTLSQPETASIIDELEHFIAQNRHLLGIVE